MAISSISAQLKAKKIFFWNRLLLSVPGRQQSSQEQLHLYLLPVWNAGHPAQHVTRAAGPDRVRALLQHPPNQGTAG